MMHFAKNPNILIDLRHFFAGRRKLADKMIRQMKNNLIASKSF